MKIRSLRAACLTLLVLPLLPLLASTDQKQKDKDKAAAPALSEKEKERRRRALDRELNRPFTQWLEQDVAYIITDEERQAFKRLQNAEEREQFITQFWLRRDPTPDTEENEARDEHYRRFAYANEHFASGIPGWKTDRGRIYIAWGPPDEIESHPAGGTYERPPEEGGGITTTFPFEKWRYRHLPGVDQEVLIEFADRTMTGEYRMTIDPSEKDALLHVPNAGPTLAEELGFSNKGAPLGGAQKSEFDRLKQLVDLHRPPPVKFSDLERVATDVTIRYDLLPFQLRTDFVKITSDTVLSVLTLQLLLKDLSFQNKEGIQRGAVNVFGRVTSLTGRIVSTFEDIVQVDVPAGQLSRSLSQSRVYWQGLPLRPGRYRLNLVLKDVISGNLGTHSALLQVPRYDDETLSASSLILADHIEKVSSPQIGRGQFVIASTKVRPSVTERFRRSQPLGIYLQVYNLGLDETSRKPSATIEYALLKEGRTVFQFTENSDQVPGAAQEMTLEKRLPLSGLEPGRYKLQVKVTDQVRGQSIAPSAGFVIE